ITCLSRRHVAFCTRLPASVAVECVSRLHGRLDDILATLLGPRVDALSDESERTEEPPEPSLVTPSRGLGTPRREAMSKRELVENGGGGSGGNSGFGGSGGACPERFDGCRQALCRESLSAGRHYWEVDVTAARGWFRVGAAYGTIRRKGDSEASRLGANAESWCLYAHDNQVSAWHNGARFPVAAVSVNRGSGGSGGSGGTAGGSGGSPLRRVGILLDWEAGLLLFYCADSMRPLHSFHQAFARPLLPAVGLYFYALVPISLVAKSISVVDLRSQGARGAGLGGGQEEVDRVVAHSAANPLNAAP
ncbi:unnamed protein product, partial [Lampetra fluviatilis]